ncbi:hypothetical protein H721_02580 [Brucella ovis IntaBari-2006-46-332]|nr:hypothetical protein C010_02747 [Brucella ovis 80/125]ENR06505.1 hypothetical protein C961_02458 [Brucella ovis F8/05B]ENR18326.1 hypothetical protein C066_00003 [Brucella sp. UK5/01]ENS92139.1 hypothetical protein B999_02722 [Brucella ovis 63/96]ENS97156.1 hypothetical protein C009_02596 [Brucella ovis 81/8]ENT02556.1 hypothetical protein C038_02917 [Brucella sp. 63/311]ENT24944.1 hypothetical protein C051_00109 [Brucella sp. UK40/99]ENT76002.1 hypothetical protein H712_02725 [Brucella o
MTVAFKGSHFPRSIILHAVFFYVRYPVSYRDLQEILAERGIAADHATLNRCGCSVFAADRCHRTHRRMTDLSK